VASQRSGFAASSADTSAPLAALYALLATHLRSVMASKAQARAHFGFIVCACRSHPGQARDWRRHSMQCTLSIMLILQQVSFSKRVMPYC